MEQTLVKPGGADGNWLVVLVAWTVLVGVVYLATDFGLLGTAVGVAGLYFVYGGVRALWQSLAARRVGGGSLGALAGHAGPVEIEGTAEPVGEPLVAPLTGSECVAYRVHVRERESTSQEG